MDERVEARDFGIALPWPGGADQPVGNGGIGGCDAMVLDVASLLAE